MPVADWWAGWDPNLLVLVPLSSIFGNYSSLVLRGCKAYSVFEMQIVTTQFLVFAVVPIVANAGDDVSMWNTS